MKKHLVIFDNYAEADAQKNGLDFPFVGYIRNAAKLTFKPKKEILPDDKMSGRHTGAPVTLTCTLTIMDGGKQFVNATITATGDTWEYEVDYDLTQGAFVYGISNWAVQSSGDYTITLDHFGIQVSIVAQLFQNTPFKTIDLSGVYFGDTQVSDMFNGCAAERIDLTDADMGQVSAIRRMFSGCTNLQDIVMDGISMGGKVSWEDMFTDCNQSVNVSLIGCEQNIFDTVSEAMADKMAGCTGGTITFDGAVYTYDSSEGAWVTEKK